MPREMSPRYTIVSARPQDVRELPAIGLAAGRLLEGHAPPEVLAETTDERLLREAQAEGLLWVALAEDAPVGFAYVVLLEDELPHLEELGVHPLHGQRGLGTALVQSVCEWTARAGYSEITLTTFREVPWNMPFYCRLGFEEVATGEIRPAIAAIVRDEAARGLDPRSRAVLRYRPAL
jgi:GNAT superfamily N-acetyltransferase